MASRDRDRRTGDEGELVRRAQDGDVDAYDALLRAHQTAARRLGAVLVGPGDADEVVQDAFVKAWDGLPSFRAPAAFRPWLLRIVANEARNRRRAAGRRARYELRFAADRSVAPTGPTPESAVLAGDVQRTIRIALADLPQRERDVVTCRHVVGLTEQETATVLGIPRGTVKSRAARGLARLRTHLDRGDGGAGGGDDD